MSESTGFVIENGRRFGQSLFVSFCFLCFLFIASSAVIAKNDPPVMVLCPTSLSDGHCNVFEYDFDATDIDGDSLTFKLISGPGTMDPITGIWTWTTATLANVGQSITIIVSANDGIDSVTCGMNIFVTNAAPVFSCPGGVVSVQAGANKALVIAATDADECDNIIYSVIDVGGTTGIISVDSDGLVNYNPTEFDATLTQPITMIIEATDGLFGNRCEINWNVTLEPIINSISLEKVIGGGDSDRITVGSTVELQFRIIFDSNNVGGLWNYSNAMRVFSPDGAILNPIAGNYLPAWPSFGERNISLLGSDTIVFHGEDSSGGFLNVYDDVGWSVMLSVPNNPELVGLTICLDAIMDMDLFGQINGSWLWASLQEQYAPSWDGSHCFTITEQCCRSATGNVDNDPEDEVDISDLTFLIDFLFINFPEMPCVEEGNVDGDGGIDISDLTFLIDHLFINFPELPACP